MNLTVSYCNQCPCMGEDTESGVSYCVMSKIYGDEECIVYEDEDVDADYESIVPPSWCRLRTEALRLSLETDETKIDEVRKKIEFDRREKLAKRRRDEINEQIRLHKIPVSKEWDEKTDKMIDIILNEYFDDGN